MKVQALDKTGMMMEVLRNELVYFNNIKSKFVLEFSYEDFHYIEQVRLDRPPPSIIRFLICCIQGWKAKQVRTKSGDQAWGLFIATK